MICPDCKGTGRVTLFATSEPCKDCGGRGSYRDPDGELPEILASPDFKGCSISRKVEFKYGVVCFVGEPKIEFFK